MAIKGSVTIQYNDSGSVQLIPPLGKLDRNIQVMQWSLEAPDGVKFSDPGIVFNPPPPLPNGYSPWPGEAPIRESDWQYRADVNFKVPHGNNAQMYRYDIYVETGSGRQKIEAFFSETNEKIDPDMENQPKP